MNSPKDLAAALGALFPIFSKEWGDLESEGAVDSSSFHEVFSVFSPISAECLASADARNLETFAKLVNEAVASGGDLENAVSTCFLEHASQIGVKNVLRPHLSFQAKGELR